MSIQRLNRSRNIGRQPLPTRLDSQISPIDQCCLVSGPLIGIRPNPLSPLIPHSNPPPHPRGEVSRRGTQEGHPRGGSAAHASIRGGHPFPRD